MPTLDTSNNKDRHSSQDYMHMAYLEALQSYEEGGVPVGAVMVDDTTGEVLGKGYNRRVQDNNPVSHGETDCMKNVGRLPGSRYKNVTMYTTLSPCMMCSGTIVQFGIPRVCVGEADSFAGNLDFLQQRGVNVHNLQSDECKVLMTKFIKEKPDLWNEDIAETNDP